MPSPSGKTFWGLASVRGVLANPTYTGQIYANRTRGRPARIRRSATHPIGRPKDSQVPLPPEEWIPVATIPPIVSREQFDLVAGQDGGQPVVRRPEQHRHQVPAEGTGQLRRVRPGVSGPAGAAGRQDLLHCTGKNIQVRRRTGTCCRSRSIPAGAIDELVWADLTELLRHPDRVASAMRRAAGGCWLPQELQARRENLRRGRVSLAAQIERLTDAYLGGVISLVECRRRRAELERRDAALAAQQEHLAADADRASEVAGLAASAEDFCRRVSAGLEHATFEQKRQLVELLIDRVVVTGDDVRNPLRLPDRSGGTVRPVLSFAIRLSRCSRPGPPVRPARRVIDKGKQGVFRIAGSAAASGRSPRFPSDASADSPA